MAVAFSNWVYRYAQILKRYGIEKSTMTGQLTDILEKYPQILNQNKKKVP